MKDYLPNIENIDTLNPASTSATTAKTAVHELDKLAAAHLINAAVDCGQTCIIWQRPMTDVLRQKLEGQGYTITPIEKHIARPGSMYLIEWE